MTEPNPGLVLPFGASPAGVRSLAVSLAAEGQRPSNPAAARRTGDDVVTSWLVEASGLVTLRIRRYVQLPVTEAEAVLPGALTQALVIGSARHLVQLYAAALLMDVNLPERSAQMRGESGRGPGAPLMDRFYKLLDELDEAVEGGLQGGDTDPGSGGAAFRMPKPLFPPGFGF